MTKRKKNSIINQLINNFDFKTVRIAMEIKEWEWWNLGRTPTIDELKESAKELIGKSIDKNCDLASTVGFKVEKEGNGVYSLSFILEQNFAY